MCRRKHKAPFSLPFLLLWLTPECNLQCKMCGNSWRNQIFNENKLLSFNDWISVIDSAKKLNTKVISITGGEPLLFPKIFEILNYINKSGISANLCTNGTLLTENNIIQLTKAKVKSFSISLDAPNAKLHNFIRGDDCFDKIISGLQKLKYAIPTANISINFVINHLNYKKMVEMIQFGKELGVNKINFAPIHKNLQHKYKPDNEFQNLYFNKEDIFELTQELQKLKVAAKKAKMRISSTRFLDGISDFYTKINRQQKCYAGYVSCSIDSWGNVSPCADINGTESIHNKSLELIWKSDEFRKLRGKVNNCNKPCWHTTDTELAIRCTINGLLSELPNVLKDYALYIKGRK